MQRATLTAASPIRWLSCPLECVICSKISFVFFINFLNSKLEKQNEEGMLLCGGALRVTCLSLLENKQLLVSRCRARIFFFLIIPSGCFSHMWLPSLFERTAPLSGASRCSQRLATCVSCTDSQGLSAASLKDSIAAAAIECKESAWAGRGRGGEGLPGPLGHGEMSGLALNSDLQHTLESNVKQLRPWMPRRAPQCRAH